MIPIETLIELVGIATEPWGSHGQFHAVQPTPQSIERIRRELNITIPEDYVRIASSFHASDDQPALAQHFVLLNHGHDGDCDCWDRRMFTASGERPIVYIDLESATEPSGRRFETFRAYIENFVRYATPRSAADSRRRRAKLLLEECGA